LLNSDIIAVVKRKSRLVPTLSMFNHRKIVSDISLTRSYMIRIKVIFEKLTFLEA